jgi:hypothetical protein
MAKSLFPSFFDAPPLIQRYCASPHLTELRTSSALIIKHRWPLSTVDMEFYKTHYIDFSTFSLVSYEKRSELFINKAIAVNSLIQAREKHDKITELEHK